MHALEAIGGARTVAVLAGALEGDGVAYLRPWRHQALELCWRLAADPARRHALLRRLDPATLPDAVAADLGRPDERELAVLRARTAPDRPVDALVELARTADTGTVPALTEVLGRIVAELAIAWDTRGNPPGQRHTLPADLADAVADPDRPADATQPMPVVPQRVVDAICALGGRLHRLGRIRPVCLLDAGSAAEAGDALVASIALDLLDRPNATPTELAVLLEVLRRAPYDGTPARVHRLLRHRDPHVRKHTIGLLAHDGGGAEALAATLTVLTAAADVQTARQALAALGQVGARWAAHAVAACLDHPNMNVKKAAAEALRTAGTPATVPHLLGWLGRHDNPGLRTALMSALRDLLADATTATVLAAAEQADPGRTRDLLLEALDRALPARAVAALTDQGSPAGPGLLRLIASGRVRLSAGTMADLATRMAAHGVTPPPASPATAPHPDLVTLTRDGWHDRVARRVASGHDPADLPEALLPALRRLLPDWLRLAATDPAIRPPVLRLVLGCCPAPWTDAERAAFTRSRQVLVAGLGELPPADRDGLLAVLEDLAPHLTPTAAFDVATELRRAPATPAGHRSTLPLLRLCGAVLTRADVERALADAALGADPWLGEVRVLREAFAVPEPPAPAAAGPRLPAAAGPQSSAPAGSWLPAVAGPQSSASVGSWLSARAGSPLSASVGSRVSASAGSRAPAPVGGPLAARNSRERLAALVEAWPATNSADRPRLLDRMADLQPIDAPPWTIDEEAHRPVPPPRTPHDGDLDQPRSAVHRARLLDQLEHPAPGTTQRRLAVEALRSWPEPDIQRRLLTAHLRGDADVPPTAALARTLTAADLTGQTSASLAATSSTAADRIGADHAAADLTGQTSASLAAADAADLAAADLAGPAADLAATSSTAADRIGAGHAAADLADHAAADPADLTDLAAADSADLAADLTGQASASLAAAGSTAADRIGADLAAADLTDLAAADLTGAAADLAAAGHAAADLTDLAAADSADLAAADLTDPAAAVPADLAAADLTGAAADLAAVGSPAADLAATGGAAADLGGNGLPDAGVARSDLAAAYLGAAGLRAVDRAPSGSAGIDLGGGGTGEAVLVRAVRLAAHLDPAGLAPLIPALQRLREHGTPDVRTAADAVLRQLPDRIRAGVLGEPLDPLLVPAPVEPGLPAALLEHPVRPAGAGPPTRKDLLDRARAGDAGQIRVALAALAETSGDGDTDVAELLEHLLRHPESKVRLHAHRVSRQVLDRPVYLRHSEILLTDPQPDIVRAAIRAVSGATWTPAIGAVVGLLLHADPTVRRTAEAGLTRFGQAAVPAVTKAAGRARPDRRAVYTTVLATLAATADPPS
ncbi:HEAT repeat domain-containing protein [Dactylosporangium cerinum]